MKYLEPSLIAVKPEDMFPGRQEDMNSNHNEKTCKLLNMVEQEDILACLTALKIRYYFGLARYIRAIIIL